MASEGLEKLTEVPLEFFKDGSAFIKKCQKPDKKGMYKHESYRICSMIPFCHIMGC